MERDADGEKWITAERKREGGGGKGRADEDG